MFRGSPVRSCGLHGGRDRSLGAIKLVACKSCLFGPILSQFNASRHGRKALARSGRLADHVLWNACGPVFDSHLMWRNSTPLSGDRRVSLAQLACASTLAHANAGRRLEECPLQRPATYWQRPTCFGRPHPPSPVPRRRRRSRPRWQCPLPSRSSRRCTTRACRPLCPGSPPGTRRAPSPS